MTRPQPVQPLGGGHAEAPAGGMQPDLKASTPAGWKEGRARNAEEWFACQADMRHRQYHVAKLAAADGILRHKLDSAAAAKRELECQALLAEQAAFSKSVQQQIRVHQQQRLEANAEYKALRVPHYTALRPLVLLTAEEGGPSLPERLFSRALATSLSAACTVADVCEHGPGLGGDANEAVWCEALQSRISMQDPQLARLEALERCRAAVVLASPSLTASARWTLERKLLAARLAAPPGTWRGPPLQAVIILRIRDTGVAAAEGQASGAKASSTSNLLQHAGDIGDLLRLPAPVPGYPAQQYPVTTLELALPSPPFAGDPPALCAAQAFRDAVLHVLRAVTEPLAAAGVVVPPGAPALLHPIQSHDDPQALALLAARMAAGAGTGTLGMGSTGTLAASSVGATLLLPQATTSITTQLLAAPATAALSPGASATAAFLAPHPFLSKAVEDWSVYDTLAWLQAQGRSITRWAPGVVALCIDGPLLVAMDAAQLRDYLGVAHEAARASIAISLQDTYGRLANAFTPASMQLPGPGEPAAPLMPEASVLTPAHLRAVLADVFRYYDADQSGDLDQQELGGLLAAAGLPLSGASVKDVLDDYDDDADGRLAPIEAQRLLLDLWRLTIAQQDLAAWTPSEAKALLDDAAGLDHPLETPMATPGAGAGSTRYRGHTGSRLDELHDRTCDQPGAHYGESHTSSDGFKPQPANAHAKRPAALSVRRESDSSSLAGSHMGTAAAYDMSASGPMKGVAEAGSHAHVMNHTADLDSLAHQQGSIVGGLRSHLASRAMSRASAAWGAAPPPQSAMLKGGFADAASVASAAAPWAGAMTPKVHNSGRSHQVFDPTIAAEHDVSTEKLLRPGAEIPELRQRLSELLGPLDLRRDGAVGTEQLRSALAAKGPEMQLSPLHIHLLSQLMDELQQGARSSGHAKTAKPAARGAARGRPAPTGTAIGGSLPLAPRSLPPVATQLGATKPGLSSKTTGPRQSAMGATATPAQALVTALVGAEVSVAAYLSAGVGVVMGAQEALKATVYGEQGTCTLLRKLYEQAAGPGDPVKLLSEGPRLEGAAAAEALAALLEVQSVPSTTLVRAALLPSKQSCFREAGSADEEAEEEEDEVAGGGATPPALAAARRYPTAWASATAHIVHIFSRLGEL